MSDYLSSLVARTLGAGDLVRPRLGSLFEPADATAKPPLLDEGASGPPASERRVAADPLAGIGVERESPAQSPHAPTIAEPEASEPGARTNEEPPVSPHPADAGEPGASARPARRAGTTVLVRPRRSAARLEPVPTGHELLPAEPSPHDAPPSRRAHASRATPHEPPVVRVTIGRVDVRAVQSPAPAPRPAPEPKPPPQTTLAEYLRRGARE